MTGRHVVLLGDSVFDNRSYLYGAPGIDAQLREMLPASWNVTRCALSGSRIADLANQLARIPADASHLVVSIGGNDTMDLARSFGARPAFTPEALQAFTKLLHEFTSRYAGVSEAVAARALPAALCTIYEPRVADPMLKQIGRTALGIVNGVVTREAERRGLAVIDLHLTCTDDADFVDPIHPSARGVEKIAARLAQWILSHA